MKKGETMSEEQKLKISRNRKGIQSWNKGIPNTWFNPEGLKLGRGWNKGKITPKESIKKMVEQRKKDGSYVAWNKGMKMPEMIGNTFGFKKDNYPWNKNKPHLAIRGAKNINWKGGVTPENRKIRISLEYRLWREAVWKRDNFTCQECHVRGGELQAHHIKPFALFPELRLAIDNGLTLCKLCHLKTDSWGGRLLRDKTINI